MSQTTAQIEAAQNRQLDKEFKMFVDIYNSPENRQPPGVFSKNVRDWTAGDLPQLQRGSLSFLLGAVFFDRMDLIDQITPRSMTRGEFVHAILREGQRRDMLRNEFEDQMIAPFIAMGKTPQEIAALRAQRLAQLVPIESDLPGADGQTVTRRGNMRVSDVAIYTATTDMLINNTDHPRFGPVSNVLYRDLPGITPTDRANAGFIINSDMRAYVLGYLYGSIPEFNPASPNQLLDGRVTFPNTDGSLRTRDEVQADYCPNIERVFAPGNAVNYRDAAAWAAAQARVDSLTGFQGNDASFGIFAPCPTPGNPARSDLRRAG